MATDEEIERRVAEAILRVDQEAKFSAPYITKARAAISEMRAIERERRDAPEESELEECCVLMSRNMGT